MTPPSTLPTLNALLNGASATLLLTGLVFIRRGRVPAHRACMIGAFAVSVAFLTSYLIHHARHGSTPFTGSGGLRAVYYAILLTHTVLAAAVPALAVTTLTYALRGRIDRHRAWARWTWPIWMYVSVTGVVIYWMLYRL
jgi:putative membrane protein